MRAAAQTMDFDRDGITNFPDNCPGVPNPDQADGDGLGDACEAGLPADTTPPVIAASLSSASNPAGWHNVDVTVNWSIADDESGIASSSGCDATTLTTETAGLALTCSATNGVGLSVSESVTLRIDKTPPVVAASRTPGPNGFGWNNTDVRARFEASDGLSGIDGAPTAEVVFALEGLDQGTTRTFADVAGNSATDIDKTPPTIAGARTPEPNAAGWNNTDVTVSFTCSDSLSGLTPGSPPSPTVLSAEGQSVTGACSDLAGNTTSASVTGISFDRTAPMMACAAARASSGRRTTRSSRSACQSRSQTRCRAALASAHGALE